MNEFDSPNYVEYSYEKKSEGKVRLHRRLMIALYVAFFIGGLAVCIITKLIPLFAVAPTLTLILYLCTWRLVKYDVYYELKEGHLELGKIRVNKQGRHKTPKLSIHVKEALYIAPYEKAEQCADAVRVYDYSESPSSDKRIILIWNNAGEKSAVILEATAKLAKLLASFCPNSQDLKGKAFHG